jgi:2-methylisocitrate lyase-like PEP mutase family enzyme
MTATALVDKARALTALHVPGNPIVLPNAWDAVSARVIADAGAAAIATSSAACAWSIGRADGNVMTRDEAIAPIARIAAAVDLPVTADIETGYGDDAALADTVRAVIGAGAVGINLEDSGGDPLYPVATAAARVSIARAAADGEGVPLYVNARTDTYFAAVGDADPRLEETLRRASAYLRAGASGIFVPGVRDLGLIRRLTDGIDGPVNVLAGGGSPGVRELAAAGVARISTGSSLAATALSALRAVASEIVADGSFAGLGSAIPYPDLNGYFR